MGRFAFIGIVESASGRFRVLRRSMRIKEFTGASTENPKPHDLTRSNEIGMMPGMANLDPLLIDLPESLVGDRVVVRSWRKGDGAALYEAVQESIDHVGRWLPWGHTHGSPENSEVFVRRWQARWDLREDMSASIWDRETGRFLGGSGLHRIDWGVRSFEIGYWVRASEEGKGYVTDATRLLTQFAFEVLEANRVFIRAAVDNTKSRAIPERLGFVQEGVHRNAIRNPAGNLMDLALYAMTPEDFFGKTSEVGE